MIFASFFAALGQIGDPRFRRVLLLGVGLTIALLVAFTTGLVWLVDALTADSVDAPDGACRLGHHVDVSGRSGPGG